MDRPRLLRVLRIAFSIACGVVCLLFVVLWVRSHVWLDILTGPLSKVRGVAIGTMPDRILVHVIDLNEGPRFVHRWEVRSETVEVLRDIARDSEDRMPANSTNFLTVWIVGPGHPIDLPIWIPICLSAAIAGVPWIRWSQRFGLRTLLIATTLVAVGLGMVAAFR